MSLSGNPRTSSHVYSPPTTVFCGARTAGLSTVMPASSVDAPLWPFGDSFSGAITGCSAIATPAILSSEGAI